MRLCLGVLVCHSTGNLALYSTVIHAFITVYLVTLGNYGDPVPVNFLNEVK